MLANLCLGRLAAHQFINRKAMTALTFILFSPSSFPFFPFWCQFTTNTVIDSVNKLPSSNPEKGKSLLDTGMFSGFEFVGHVMETLSADEFRCGLRCLRKENCESFNSHTNGVCQLSNHTRQLSPDRLRHRTGSSYYGKGRIVYSKSYISVMIFFNGAFLEVFGIRDP